MPPLNLLIKPASSLCNMRCKYCFYKDVADKRKDTPAIMTAETLELVVRRAFEYADGFAFFMFQGGEPTLAGIDFYKSLLELQNRYNVKNIKIKNSIQTNGYIIDEEWAEFFAENGFLVGLSLDGIREAHDALRVDANGRGTYDTVLKAAEILKKYNVEFNILCVVSELAAKHPKKVYDSLKKYKYLQFIPCLDPFDGQKSRFSLSGERYAEFLCQTFDLYYCDITHGYDISVRNFDNYIGILAGQVPESCDLRGHCTCCITVEADGAVYPCDFYALDEWRLGSVYEDGFERMINSDKAKAFISPSYEVHSDCKACRYYKLCRGGCRRDREPLPSLNRRCKAYKDFFDCKIGKMFDLAGKTAVRQD